MYFINVESAVIPMQPELILTKKSQNVRSHKLISDIILEFKLFLKIARHSIKTRKTRKLGIRNITAAAFSFSLNFPPWGGQGG